MVDYVGNPNEQPPECKIGEPGGKCPHLKCTYKGFDGERYRCERCGESYWLDYEDMK